MDKIKAFFWKLRFSWTAWFGFWLIALPMIQEQWDVIGGILPELVREYAFAFVGLAVILLRAKTQLRVDMEVERLTAMHAQELQAAAIRKA